MCLVLVSMCVAMGVVCGRLGACIGVGDHGVGSGCGVPLGPQVCVIPTTSPLTEVCLCLGLLSMCVAMGVVCGRLGA